VARKKNPQVFAIKKVGWRKRRKRRKMRTRWVPHSFD
jgi:hypothetical protein